MQPGWHINSRRYVRIAAIALVISGALALGLDHARAQLGLDTIRSVVDKAKGKAKSVPGKDVLKGKTAPNVKGALQKGPIAKDGIGKGKGALEKFGKDRLVPKDKAKDLIAGDKGKFGKGPADRLTDKLGKDKIGKDKLSKDALTKDKLGKDKLGKGDLAKDKLGKDKLSKDALTKDKLGKDKLGKGDLAKDKLGKDKLGKGDFAKDKLGKDKAGIDKIGKGKAVPDKRAATRIARAQNPVERGKIRVDHRRDINVARLRLPPRPFPGTAGFTAVPPAGETRFISTEMVFHVGPNVSQQTVNATAARLGLTVVGVQASGITGGTLYHFRLPPGRAVSDVVRALETERVGIPSPNYVYRIVQDTASDTASPAGSPEQYTIEKLRLAEVHKVATGREVLVAVIELEGRHQSSRSRRRYRRGIRRRRPIGAGAFARHRHDRRYRVAPQAARHCAERPHPRGARLLDHDPAIAGSDHTANHRRHRMGHQQGRAHHQYEFRRPVRSHDPARDAQRRRQGRHPDRSLWQYGCKVAAALSGRRSECDRGDRDRRERLALHTGRARAASGGRGTGRRRDGPRPGRYVSAHHRHVGGRRACQRRRRAAVGAPPVH